MNTRIAFIAAASALAVTGCATYDGAEDYRVAETGAAVPGSVIEPYTQWPAELRGTTVQLTTEGGESNAVNFAADGTLTIQPDPGAPVVKGFWGQRDEWVCTNFAPRGEECWPYAPVVAANGQPVVVTSNRGQRLTVEVQSAMEEEALDRG